MQLAPVRVVCDRQAGANGEDAGNTGNGHTLLAWGRHVRQLETQRERLLEDGEDDADVAPSQNQDRFKSFLTCYIWCAACTVTSIVLSALIFPWGDAAYDAKLVERMNTFADGGVRISTSCLYKQFNNGLQSFGPYWLGLGGDQEDNSGRSPDILYYHHQGNMLELVAPDNDTEWLSITFAQWGLGWRLRKLMWPQDIIRYTKECYFWCGRVSPENGNLHKFSSWLESMREERYNGFRLNCLQFSQRLWDFLAPTDLGCAPADLVNSALLAKQRLEHAQEKGNQSKLPVE